MADKFVCRIMVQEKLWLFWQLIVRRHWEIGIEDLPKESNKLPAVNWASVVESGIGRKKKDVAAKNENNKGKNEREGMKKKITRKNCFERINKNKE